MYKGQLCAKLRRSKAYPLLLSIVIWGSTTLEVLLRSGFPLPPIPTTASHNPCCVCISLLHLPPSFRLQSLGLSAPAATTGVVVFPMLITYLAATFAATELPAFFVPRVQVAPNYTFVKFRTADVPQTRKSLRTCIELDEAESAWCPQGVTLTSSRVTGPDGLTWYSYRGP